MTADQLPALEGKGVTPIPREVRTILVWPDIAQASDWIRKLTLEQRAAIGVVLASDAQRDVAMAIALGEKAMQAAQAREKEHRPSSSWCPQELHSELWADEAARIANEAECGDGTSDADHARNMLAAALDGIEGRGRVTVDRDYLRTIMGRIAELEAELAESQRLLRTAIAERARIEGERRTEKSRAEKAEQRLSHIAHALNAVNWDSLMRAVNEEG